MDLLSLGSISGQVTKGYKGCVVCLDDTHARWLTKIIRWFTWVIVGFFINIIHIIETKKSFDGTREDRLAPKIRDGRQIFKAVSELNVVFRKGEGNVSAHARSLWKKKSLLWRLPYWQFMIVCHALDAMP